MGVKLEVVGGESFEGGGRAVGHVDMNVHAARAEQGGVKAIDVVGGEDNDPLIPAA